MLQVFLAENGFFYWYEPVDAEREILDADAGIGLRMVEVVALILEDSSFGENGKAMGKASGDEELTMIILCQFNRNMLTEGG